MKPTHLPLLLAAAFSVISSGPCGNGAPGRPSSTVSTFCNKGEKRLNDTCKEETVDLSKWAWPEPPKKCETPGSICPSVAVALQKGSPLKLNPAHEAFDLEIRTCGLQIYCTSTCTASLCTNGAFEPATVRGDLREWNFNHKSTGTPIKLQVSLAMEHGVYNLGSALLRSSATEPTLASYEFPKDQSALSYRVLEHSNDLNEIYWSLNQLHSLYANGNNLDKLKSLAGTFKDKIATSGNQSLQLRFLRSFDAWFSTEFTTTFELAEEFLKSPNDDLRKLSTELLFATYINSSSNLEEAAKIAVWGRLAGFEDKIEEYLSNTQPAAIQEKAIEALEHIGSSKATRLVSQHRSAKTGPATLKVLDVFVGQANTCAITNESRPKHPNLFCWGRNEWSQSGKPSSEGNVLRPNPISGKNGKPTHWSTASLNQFFSCMIEQNTQELYCIGRELFLGMNKSAPPEVPQPFHSVEANGAPTKWSQVSVGDYCACTIRMEGTPWCWGSPGGVGKITAAKTPEQVSNERWSSVSISKDSKRACGIKKDDSSLVCWGEFGDGLFTAGTGTNPNKPKKVKDFGSAGRKFVSVTVGDWLSVALDTSGKTWRFDRNGDANDDQSHWMSFSLGSNGGFCGIKKNAASADSGELLCSALYNPSADMPTQWKKVAVGGGHTCAIDADNDLWCWGSNHGGQLGLGFADPPVELPRLGEVQKPPAAPHPPAKVVW